VSSLPRRPGPVLVVAVAGSLTSLLLYFLVRPHVGGDAAALALGAAPPIVLTAAASAWRRQSRILGLMTVAGFGLVLAATFLAGGSALPLKLYRPVATAVLGSACLVSVAVGRPLLLSVLRLLARDDPARGRLAERVAASPAGRRRLAVVTAVIGASLLVEAAGTIVLALSVPTATFLVASRIVRFAVLAAGLGTLAWYLRRGRAGGQAAPAAGGDESGGDGEEGGADGEKGGPDGEKGGARRSGSEGRPRTAWFGPMRLGIGWGRPQTWQARLLVLAVIAAIIVLRMVAHG
jgi:hypothetical protein